MIYEGFNNNIKSFSIQEFNDLNYQINNYLNLDKNTIIYLIRHGQALHNVIKQYKKIFDVKYYDPKLTSDGEKQAFNISKYLIDDIFKNFNIKKDIILHGSSCLLRAIQTNLIIKKNIEKYMKNKKQKLYIIPNLNENMYINQYFYNLGIFEYILNNIYYTNTLNYDFHLKNKNDEIIWDLYFNYKNNCNNHFYDYNTIDILYYINQSL